MNEDAKLQNLAKQIGAQAVERLDVRAIAQSVVARLRSGEQAAPRPSWISPAWLRIAAALVIVIGGSVVLRQATLGPREPAHPPHFVADDLSDFSAEQLRDVLGSLDEIVGGTSASDSSGDLHELDAQQLRAVLRSLEG